jgi:hypothetical protein
MKITKGTFLLIFFLTLSVGVFLYFLTSDFQYLKITFIFDLGLILGRFLTIHNFKFIPKKLIDND